MTGKVWLFSLYDWRDSKYFSETDPEFRIEVTEDMLSWPIRYKSTDNFLVVIDAIEVNIYKNILKVLANLDGFTSAILLRVHSAEKWIELRHEKRFSIYFDNHLVFDSGVIRGESISEISSWAGVESDTVENWSVDEWKKFFLKRIESTIKDQLEIEKERKLVIQDDIDFERSVLQHLGKLPEEDREVTLLDGVLRQIVDCWIEIYIKVCDQESIHAVADRIHLLNDVAHYSPDEIQKISLYLTKAFDRIKTCVEKKDGYGDPYNFRRIISDTITDVRGKIKSR